MGVCVFLLNVGVAVRVIKEFEKFSAIRRAFVRTLDLRYV